jgi:hypothetical protein
MAFDHKDMSGSLFNNDRKEKETHPDRTGTAKIDGREYWVSGWIKDGAKGKFMSLAFKPKDGKTEERIPGSAKTPVNIDDDVPF